VQECRWEFLVFSGKFPLELTVSEQPGERRVVFSLAESPFMRSFQGTWQARGTHVIVHQKFLMLKLPLKGGDSC
jgi:hypothetical protein